MRRPHRTDTLKQGYRQCPESAEGVAGYWRSNINWKRFRLQTDAYKDKGVRACLPGRKQRNETVKYDKCRYKRRNRIEIMFGRLKDWQRVAT